MPLYNRLKTGIILGWRWVFQLPLKEYQALRFLETNFSKKLKMARYQEPSGFILVLGAVRLHEISIQ